MVFPPTRAAALAQLAAFVPQAVEYALKRNFEQGTVSRLSPYIRTRLLTEDEVTAAVLCEHQPQSTGKFLQEIAWRTYWKGWLEMRPNVWTHYQETLITLEKNAPYDRAIAGETGIACFDQWVHELRENGYLHNHARMWFASIWIFTLKLPWQLGADYFLTHLLDADPAANTLSWRWVAGLHTIGKHYLARAENIAKFTEDRFNPVDQLDETALPLRLDQAFAIQPLKLPENHRPSGRVGHLMFPEDLASPPSEFGEIQATAGFLPPALETTPLVTGFLKGALADALARSHGTRLDGDFVTAVTTWARAENLTSILISYPTVGPTRDFLDCHKTSLPLSPFVRSWDRQLWPHATAGFFKFRSALPNLFQNQSIP